MSEFFKAVVLSLIEGLTEFIPVSSTGHLILVGEALSFQGDQGHVFEIFIQLGAILAVVAIYPGRFLDLLDFSRPGGFRGREGCTKLLIASLPALFMGFLLHGFIKEHLFNSTTVALGLLVGGLMLVIVDRDHTRESVSVHEAISYWQAFVVGCFQCLALWPGMSRSGSTIIGARLLGFERKLAAEFSFFMAVPIMLAATAYDILKNYHSLSAEVLPLFAIGFIISFLSALLAIRVFLGVLERFSLRPFGWYRIILALIVLILLR